MHCAKAFILSIIIAVAANAASTTQPTRDDGTRYLLTPDQLSAGSHHTRHAQLFSRGVDGYNLLVLKGIDKVQATAMNGGGYFIGVHATPAESPIGYKLRLFGSPLLDPPRKTSYCSGSTYTAFIEAMNLIEPDGAERLSPVRLEALRMQEPDGGRRNDGVKFWGHWNDDGPGTQYALVQYANMGVAIEPIDARPGDFMNISWKSGNGHSTVFLGWHENAAGKKFVLYWASQKGTNGLGDQMSAIDKIVGVKIIRLTKPGNVFTFNPAAPVNRKIAEDPVDWN